LTNSCNANQAAKDVCATAQKAAAAATAKTGAQADAFNGVFGITTVSSLIYVYESSSDSRKIQNFAAVAVIDNQGNVVSPGSGGSVPPVPSQTSQATATPAASGSGIGNFGKCTVPQIEFATGFDGRKETSFQPVDKGLENRYPTNLLTDTDVLFSFFQPWIRTKH
jgi:hypothetical protein